MQLFEIHITGDRSILETADSLSLKTITIDLLKPDKSYLRTEYMTSQVKKFENYVECKKFVDDVVNKLEEMGTKIFRVKIECPYHRNYVKDSLYLEVHFDADNDFFPMSRNQDKDSILATFREYNQADYKNLFEFFFKDDVAVANPVIELCLFDSNVEEDFDWFNLY